MSQFPQTRRVELDYGTDNGVMVSFFNTVYAWMAVGLALTAAVSWYVSQSPQIMSYFVGGRAFSVFILLGMFAIAMAVQSAALRISAGVGTLLFLVYATLMGGLLAPIFLIYELGTIGSAFLITGGTFAAMSVYGFVTKRDLTKMGAIFMMALVGLILASLVNIFWANNAMSWVITYAVLTVFIGLTAYETQKLKVIADQLRDQPQLLQRYAIIGSLVLYIAFINMFMSILRILGSRR
jgi:FtsH-binding integral membrane protein